MVLCHCNTVETFLRHVLNFDPNQNNTHVFITDESEKIDFILTVCAVLNNENLRKIITLMSEAFVLFCIF